MLEGQSKDPEVSLKSLLHIDELVMNLRPYQPNKHVGKAWGRKGVTWNDR